METVRLIPDPHKRMRLGLLLDRLTTQLHKSDCFRLRLPHFPDPYATEDQTDPPQRYSTHDAFGFQEVPLDLSLKHETSRVSIKTEVGDESPPQLVPQCNYNGQRIKSEITPSPLRVVEQVDNGADLPYVCDVCGQMFSLHDRLAKHVASRHRSRRSSETAGRNYECSTCGRRFARSDMLTRHARLHTGLKPYSCNLCGQVFSRSDHLATHQRTHTGEKPYKCPQCSYAACRRDMITRHMRTHSRPSTLTEPPVTEVPF